MSKLDEEKTSLFGGLGLGLLEAWPRDPESLGGMR